jgi:hypothetical protein
MPMKIAGVTYLATCNQGAVFRIVLEMAEVEPRELMSLAID